MWEQQPACRWGPPPSAHENSHSKKEEAIPKKTFKECKTQIANTADAVDKAADLGNGKIGKTSKVILWGSCPYGLLPPMRGKTLCYRSCRRQNHQPTHWHSQQPHTTSKSHKASEQRHKASGQTKLNGTKRAAPFQDFHKKTHPEQIQTGLASKENPKDHVPKESSSRTQTECMRKWCQ